MPVLIAIPKDALIPEFIAALPPMEDERWFAVGWASAQQPHEVQHLTSTDSQVSPITP